MIDATGWFFIFAMLGAALYFVVKSVLAGLKAYRKYTCCECGGEGSYRFRHHEGNWYCNNCLNKKFKICSYCDELFDKGARFKKFDGKEYCGDCYEEHVGKCDKCGKKIAEDDDSYECDECGDDTICGDCMITDLENVSLCKSCADKAYPREVEYRERIIESPSVSTETKVSKFNPLEKTRFD